MEAFVTPSGHYEYRVMPYGLSNLPSIFQTFMNEIFRDMLNRSVIVYTDDILIYSPNLEEHQRHVTHVLQRLREHHLYLKGEKCEFHKTTVQFLGYVITPEGVQMDQRKYSQLSAPLHALAETQESHLDLRLPQGLPTAKISLLFCTCFNQDPTLRFVVEWDLDDQIRAATLAEPAPLGGPEGKDYVPTTLRLTLLDSVHTSPGSGHPGSQRTLSLLRNRYWWPSVAQDVARYVKGCSVCAMTTTPRRLPEGKL
ncbi:hypothetical protein M9458_051812, partial [Cirrhinus mrigala]